MSSIKFAACMFALVGCHAAPAPGPPRAVVQTPHVLDEGYIAMKGFGEPIGETLAARDGLWVFTEPRYYYDEPGEGHSNGTDIVFMDDVGEIGRLHPSGWTYHLAMVGDVSGGEGVHVGSQLQLVTRLAAVNIPNHFGDDVEPGAWNAFWTRTPEGRAFDCGDVDGDGSPDFCTSSHIVLHPMSLVDQSESREVLPSITWHADHKTVGVAADLNDDGLNEVYVTGPTGLVRVDDQGSGHLDLEQLEAHFPGETIAALAVARLHGDGPSMLLAAIGDEVWSLDGSGVTQRVAAGLPGRVLALSSGDLDGDGRDELVVGTYGSVFVFDGDGVQRAWWTTEGDEAIGGLLAVADLNLDGFDDVLIAAPGYNKKEPGAAFGVIAFGAYFRVDGPL